MKGIHGLMRAALTAAGIMGALVLVYRFVWDKKLRWRAKPLGKCAAVLTLSAMAGRWMLPKY